MAAALAPTETPGGATDTIYPSNYSYVKIFSSECIANKRKSNIRLTRASLLSRQQRCVSDVESAYTSNSSHRDIHAHVNRVLFTNYCSITKTLLTKCRPLFQPNGGRSLPIYVLRT